MTAQSSGAMCMAGQGRTERTRSSPASGVPVGGHRAGGGHAKIVRRNRRRHRNHLVDRQTGEAHGVGDCAIERQARAGQIRRAGQRDAAVVAEVASRPARSHGPAAPPAAAIASVIEDGPPQPLGPDHRLHRRGRQMMAVGDQARVHAVGGEQFPNRVGMPGQDLRRTRCRDASPASRRRQSRRQSWPGSPPYGRSRRGHRPRRDARSAGAPRVIPARG